MIETILTQVFAIVSSVIAGFATLLTDLVELVFVGEDLTPFGLLVLLVAAVPLAWSLITYIVTFFKKATKIK